MPTSLPATSWKRMEKLGRGRLGHRKLGTCDTRDGKGIGRHHPQKMVNKAATTGLVLSSIRQVVVLAEKPPKTLLDAAEVAGMALDLTFLPALLRILA